MTADRRARVALSVGWAASALIVNPTGNFPINDDWSYAFAVESVLERHQWRLTDWTSMPVGPQVLWGALFCLPTGFSFVSLRISTLVLAWMGVLGVYQLARACGGSPRLALIAALTLAANPLYCSLSFTYMTDVPFTAVSVWGMVFLVRYFSDHRRVDYAAALILVSCATLIRQLGMAVSFAALVALLLDRPSTSRAAAWAFPVIGATLLAAYYGFLELTHVPVLYSKQWEDLVSTVRSGPVHLVLRLFLWSLQVFVYTGTFLLPFIVASTSNVVGERRARRWFIVAVSSISVGLSLYLIGIRMPFWGNILNDLSLQPAIIAGAEYRPRAPGWVWILITAAGVLGGSVLGTRLFVDLRRQLRSGLWQQPDSQLMVFLTLSAALYIAPLLPTAVYDRYLLFWFVALMAASIISTHHVAGEATVGHAYSAFGLIAWFAIVAILLTHDTLAFNRARWAAVDAGLAAGTPRFAIHGGFEVNGWLWRDVEGSPVQSTPWWEAEHDQGLVLALAPMEGYSVDGVFEFQRWLPWAPSAVYALRPMRGAR